MLNRRELFPLWDKALMVLAVLASLYHIYALGLEATGMWQLRAVHLLVALMLCPMLYRGWKGSPDRRPSVADLIMMAAGLAVTIYVLIEQNGLAWREDIAPTPWDIFFGTILLLLVMEITRRVVGWPLNVLILVFLGYSLFASHLPGILMSKSYSYSRIISHIFSTDGFYGIPIGASATFVFLFIVFGAFLRASRVGDFFINLSYSVAGRTRGGPAKVAIFASALMGTIQGSGISNVVTTGTLTIPLMKRTGFQPYFAGAVEAAASTGGQIMPPIMGAAAFLMAGLISIPYVKIVIAATIPAILFYLALFLMIDFEAAKEGLKGLSRGDLPVLREVLSRWGHLSIPIFVLLYMLLIEASSPIRAALFSTGACLITSWFRKQSRMGISAVTIALREGALGALSVIVACGAAGVIVGLVSLSGIGIKLSQAIISLSGGNLLIALILTMFITIILSMGLPTTGAYILAAVVIGPALSGMGITTLQANLFIFYFACMSAITPPVALVAYPAAGIAGANPLKVGFAAWRLSLTAFIVPYMFVYAPSLLCIGPWHTILWTVVTAVMGVSALAIGMSRWFIYPLSIWKSALCSLSALALIFPGIVTDTIGFGVLLAVLLPNFVRLRKTRILTAEGGSEDLPSRAGNLPSGIEAPKGSSLESGEER